MAPLTVFLGANASGKSAILDSLGLLAQTATSHSNQQGFTWKGRWVDFDGLGKSAFHNGRSDCELVLGVGVQTSADLLDHDPPALDDPVLDARYTVHHNPAKNSWQHIVELGHGRGANNSFIPGPGQQPVLKFNSMLATFNPLGGAGSIFSSQLFGISSIRENAPNTDIAEARRIGSACGKAIDLLREWLAKRLYLVGPDRLPRGEDPKPQKNDLTVGRHGQDTLNLLSYLFASPEHSEIAEKIQFWSQAFGLRGLKAGWVRQKELQAGFNDPESRTALSLQHAGYGSQQILPVITQIYAAPKQSSVLIEEPEISLHPSAQVEIVKLFGDAIQYGQQLLVTTHSQILPLALSELEKYDISPDDVAIYHLTRNKDSVRVQRLEVDRKWNLPGWIPSFSAVESRLLKTWISKVHDDIQ